MCAENFRCRWHALGVFVLFVVLGLVTAGGHLYSPDEEVMFRVTESMATRAALDIEPIPDGTPGGGFASAAGTNGLQYAQYGLGNSVVAIPFYWAGAAACRFITDDEAARLLDFKTVIYAPIERGTPGYGHALLQRAVTGTCGVFLFALTCAVLWVLGAAVAERAIGPLRRTNSGVVHGAWTVALAYGLGTLAWAHSRTFFSEPLAALGMIAAFTVAVTGSGRLTPQRALAAGTCFAVALFARLDSAVVLPGLALTGLLRYASDELGGEDRLKNCTATEILSTLFRAKFWKIIMMFSAGGAVFALVHFALNAAHFGNAFTSAYADQAEGIRFTTPLIAGLYGFLFSVGKGVFFFSPILVLAVCGWGRLGRSSLALAVGLSLALFALIVFHARWQNWTGGWCWGPRHFFAVGALAVPAVAAFMANAGATRRVVFCVLLAVGAGVQLYGTSQSFVDYYILYFRTPEALPQARPLYSPEDSDPQTVTLQRAMPDGSRKEITFGQLTAPIQDSIYMPQNSQWVRYAEMHRYGYTDNLWLRLMRRAAGNERVVLPE